MSQPQTECIQSHELLCDVDKRIFLKRIFSFPYYNSTKDTKCNMQWQRLPCLCLAPQMQLNRQRETHPIILCAAVFQQYSFSSLILSLVLCNFCSIFASFMIMCLVFFCARSFNKFILHPKQFLPRQEVVTRALC